MPSALMLFDHIEHLTELISFQPVVFQHIVLLENIQYRQRRAAGQSGVQRRGERSDPAAGQPR